MANPTMDNLLVQVQTYQEGLLAYLQNLNVFVATANTRFKEFEKLTANLGSSVTFDLPYRFTTADSLVATFQPLDQRFQTLVADQSKNVSFVISAEQLILFKLEEYMSRIGKGAIRQLSATIESQVAAQCIAGVPAGVNSAGNPYAGSGNNIPFRFYGNSVTQINSYTQLSQAVAMFENFGSAVGEHKAYVSDTVIPSIIGSGLQQFAESRNNEIANSWELGRFYGTMWYKSNLLPIHLAGSEGINGTVLTVVSTTLNAAGQVIAITFSGTHAASDPNSVLQYDRFQFNDGVAGFTNMRYLTFTGYQPSSNPVQFFATANAASTAGSDVTVSIYPPLQAGVGNTQNLNQQIQAGMQASVLPSHRAGLLTSGDPLFIAMPRLPDEMPYPTGNRSDPDTGVSVRMYYGSLFGQDQHGIIHDALWGSTLVPEYGMVLVFPV
jgi:hypothetical protein